MLYCAVHTVAHWQAAVNDVLYCTCCIVQCTQWHTDRLLWMMYCTVHAVLCSAHSGTLTRSCEWCTVLYCTCCIVLCTQWHTDRLLWMMYCTVHAVLCCAHSGTLTGCCECADTQTDIQNLWKVGSRLYTSEDTLCCCMSMVTYS